MSIVSCDSIVYLGSWLRSASAEKKRFSKVIRISYEIRKWEMRLLATGVSSANRTDVVYKGVMSSYCLKIISVIESAKKNSARKSWFSRLGWGVEIWPSPTKGRAKKYFCTSFLPCCMVHMLGLLLLFRQVWCTMSCGLQRNNFVLVAETTCGQANSPAAACAQGESSAPILIPGVAQSQVDSSSVSLAKLCEPEGWYDPASHSRASGYF